MQFIESFFGVTYREFIAMLGRLIAQSPSEVKMIGISVRGYSGSVVTINIEEASR